MLIVYWPITIKFRTCKQTSKPQTNYRCCLWFCYLAPYWLISGKAITFHKYFWGSQFCEFHSKCFFVLCKNCLSIFKASELKNVDTLVGQIFQACYNGLGMHIFLQSVKLHSWWVHGPRKVLKKWLKFFV